MAIVHDVDARFELENFRKILAQRKTGYELIEHQDSGRVQVRFEGMFEGVAVIWDCEFCTLRNELRRLASSDHDGDSRTIRCFIEIGECSGRGRALHIGLDLDQIDEPAIQKMMVMVRNYKLLKMGRHEFGEPYCLR